MRKPVRSPTTHAFHESLRYACKTRTKLHVPAFSNRSDSEAPAMETRYIRFASDYICNRDGLSFRGALITGLDPPRLLAFAPLPPSFRAVLPSMLPLSIDSPFFALISTGIRQAKHSLEWQFPCRRDQRFVLERKFSCVSSPSVQSA